MKRQWNFKGAFSDTISLLVFCSVMSLSTQRQKCVKVNIEIKRDGKQIEDIFKWLS